MNSATVALSNLDFSEDILYPVFYVRNNLLEGLPGLSEKDSFTFIVDLFGNIDCAKIYATSISVSESGGSIRTPNFSCDYLTFDTMTSNSTKKSPIMIEKNYLKIGSIRSGNEGDLDIELSSNRIGFTNDSARVGWIRDDKIAYKAGYFGSWTDAASTLTTGIWIGKSASNTPLMEFYSGGTNKDDLILCNGGMGFSSGASGNLIIGGGIVATVEGGIIRKWTSGTLATGSFKSQEGWTVTVKDGSITSIS